MIAGGTYFVTKSFCSRLYVLYSAIGNRRKKNEVLKFETSEYK